MFSRTLYKISKGSSPMFNAQNMLSKSQKRHAGHYKGYNEPTGNFLGIPPAPPGMKRKRLWFENYYARLFGYTWLAFFIVWYYKPKDEFVLKLSSSPNS